MNIEITDLDMILNYLETTSLEPHDDYSSEFTYKDQKKLYKYIKQLQQENQQLKEDIKNIIKILNKNCDDLEATEEEFDSLDRWQELQVVELEQGSDE